MESDWALSEDLDVMGGSILRTASVSKSAAVLLGVLLVLLVIAFLYAFFGWKLSWLMSILIFGALALFVFNEYRYIMTPRFKSFSQKNINRHFTQQQAPMQYLPPMQKNV